ncbi:MAG: exodeoxyribonuclease VII large subunit [Candidatus Saccharimonas aalborgensis]
MTNETQNLSAIISVSDFTALLNQTLEYAYSSVEIEGEVASFKVNQNKYVFFDLKDEQATVSCFMSVWQLRIPIEDGMKVVIKAVPKLTAWGKFSLTVQSVRPSGAGSLKKSFELLREKLAKEGLFAPERKRLLPRFPQRVAVISSTEAAGYKDFIKILDNRWGGVAVEVAHVQVQGERAADQIIRAVKYFNEKETLADVLVVVRGGGSADDLSTFNDELLVREMAASRIPTLVGIGHDVDETLIDFVADVRAATPSNAAELLVLDRREVIASTNHSLMRIASRTEEAIGQQQTSIERQLSEAVKVLEGRCQHIEARVESISQLIEAYNPREVLERGYAVVRGRVEVGSMISVERKKDIITAEVKDVKRT